ncbi:MAG: hypothetical protein IH624_02810 [Phycisphaerae bacterium]|nr:hypothetical protein [Phycisphaerae bacterium]
MNEKAEPRFLVVAVNLIIMFFALVGLSLSASIALLWLRLVTAAIQSLLIVLAVLQCVLYAKCYIDHRVTERI